MKILAILPLVPYPPDRGDRLRAWEMLNGLATAGDLEIVVIAVEPMSPGAVGAIKSLGGHLHYHQLDRTALGKGIMRTALRRGAPSIGAYWQPALGRRLAWECPGPWDIVVAFQLRAAEYALVTEASVRALELTDSLSLYRGRLRDLGRSRTQRWALRGVDELERRVPRLFDICWVSALEDADAVAALSGVRPTVVPNGCIPVSDPSPYRPDGALLFLGDMRYPPNEDGILAFVETVWERLKEVYPNLTLHIIGRTTPRVERTAMRHGVVPTGPLEDVRGELETARAVINPVRFGSGSSRKVLAGCAAARPVISTQAGIRGLALKPGYDVLLAETPEDWVNSIAWLHDNPLDAEALGRRAWSLASTLYDAEHIWRTALSTLGTLDNASSG